MINPKIPPSPNQLLCLERSLLISTISKELALCSETRVKRALQSNARRSAQNSGLTPCFSEAAIISPNKNFLS